MARSYNEGIKENWKHAVLNGLLFGLVLFGLIVGGSFLVIHFGAAPIWSGIGVGALILVFMLFGMVVAINCAQDVYYTNGYFTTVKNSFCLLGLLNWKVLVTFLLSTGAVVILGCFNLITLIIGMLLFAVLNSVVIILYTLISHNGFDKYINSEHYPDYVNKGLYKLETNDKEA